MRWSKLLAALANQTGGNLYIAEPMARANEAEKITVDRAKQENTRRGAIVGASLADWVRATVYWPAGATFPAELGQVFPKSLPPLRSDRDTIVFGALTSPLKNALEIRAQVMSNGKPVELKWAANPENKGDSYAFLPQVVEMAQHDGGISLPTLGTAGLAETGRLLEAGIDNLTDLAERAVVTGDVDAAKVAAKAALARDPGNIKAKTVELVVEKKRTQAQQVGQVTEPTIPAAPVAVPPAPAAAPQVAPSNDLKLIRPTPAQPAPVPPRLQDAAPAGDPLPPPAAGSLTDRYAPAGQLLDETEQRRRVLGQLMRREVENVDHRRPQDHGRRSANGHSESEARLAKRSAGARAEPRLRAQFIDKLQIALREAQRQASIKDERDAQLQEEQAAGRERRLLNERLARNREKEKQLVDRFGALVDEGHYDEALEWHT